MRRTVAGVAMTIAIASAGGASSALAAGPVEHVGHLNVGQHRFWDGARVTADESSAALAAGNAGCDALKPCWEYAMDLAAGGHRLRVALDQYQVADVFDLEIRDPLGRLVAGGTTDSAEGPVEAATDLRSNGALYGQYSKLGLAGGYSTEVFAPTPMPGRWTFRVLARRVVKDTVFRMRAKLERPPSSPPGQPRALLPNLIPVPPFEFTLADPMPGSSNGCRPDERTEGARRCLRFTMGPQNVGEGKLDLRYEPLEGAISSGDVDQRIHYSDGSVRERPAGRAFYHPPHAHYHYAGFGLVALYHFDGETMTHVEDGPKTGACTVPYRLSEWKHFTAEPRYSAPHDCLPGTASPARGAAIGLAAGWTDIYGWDMSGNYVEFGGQPDGRYVVIVGADWDPGWDIDADWEPGWDGDVLESDETDNASYALVDIKGDHVTVLERGVGRGPLDPDRRLVDDRYPTNP